MHLSLKMLSGMANSEDPAQTSSEAVWSGSTLAMAGYYACSAFIKD